ncbi:PAS domain S-box protein [Solidesulfovibrio sp.]
MQEAETDLASIAKFKVEQIENWQHERLSDAFVLMENPSFSQAAEGFLKSPNADDERDLRQRLQSLKTHYQYRDILLVDVDGQIRLRLAGHDAVRLDLGEALQRAFDARRPVLTGIHTDREDNDHHLSVIVPLSASQDPDHRMLGAVVLNMSTSQFLAPLLQTWPTHSTTAETLLVRRDGDQARILTDLRHEPGAVLKRKISMSRTSDPIVLALLGSRGLVRGQDYRGHDVVAFSTEVPGTAWIMVSKMDADEVYSAWRHQSLLIFTLLAISLAGLGGAALLLWQRKQKEYFQAQFVTEARLRESLELERITLSSIGDGVISADAQGRVVLLNPVAERLTGWSMDKARGEKFEKIFRIIHEETRQPADTPVARVLAEGITLELASHTVLIAADGSERPIADSAAPIHNDGGDIVGMVLVFRDCSAERQAEKTKEALYATEMRYRELVESARSIIVKVDTSGNITFFNEFAQSFYGFTEQEVIGRHLVGTIVPEQDSYSLDMRGFLETILAMPDEHLLVENQTIRRDGSRAWVSWSNKPLYDENGQLLGILSVGTDITARKEAEEALHKSERALRFTLDGLSAHIALLDDQGTILLTNKGWQEFAQQNGTTATTVSEGVNYLRVCDLASGNNAQEAPRFAEGIRSVLEGKSETFTMEYPCNSTTEMRWFVGRVTLFPEDLPRRAIVSHENITERKRTEDELLKRWQIMEQTPACIVITDKRGNIEYVNPYFSQMTSYCAEEVMGKNPRILKSGLHSDDFYRDMWKTISTGNLWRGNICNRRKDGTTYWESATISFVTNSTGEVTHYIAIKEDITSKIELEELREDMDRITRHDLKSPLNGIIGLPQLLMDDENVTAEQREYLRMIIDAGLKMLNMINLSLDLIRMEHGTYELETRPVNMLLVLGQVIAHLDALARGKGIAVQLLIDGRSVTTHDVCMVQADELLCYSVLSNLIKNALESSPEGASVTVEMCSQNCFHVAIRNLGEVPPEFRLRFFEKYATLGKRNGSGLGTYSAQLMAHAMGGDIILDTSEPGATTVTLRLPLPTDPLAS